MSGTGTLSARCVRVHLQESERCTWRKAFELLANENRRHPINGSSFVANLFETGISLSGFYLMMVTYKIYAIIFNIWHLSSICRRTPNVAHFL